MQSLPHLSGEADWKNPKVLQSYCTGDQIHKVQAFGLDFWIAHPNIEDTETEKLRD